jgi:hypothetical protein
MVAGIIARVPERDYRWMALVKDQLGISEVVLQDYLAHGDSVLLASWIHVNRRYVRFYQMPGPMVGSMRFVLPKFQKMLSQFDAQNALPELQHDFRALWNEITRTHSKFLSSWFLSPVRHLYIALHQGTGAAPSAFDASTEDDDYSIHEDPSSYPSCNIPGHHPQINIVAATAENTHPSAIPLPTVLPPHSVLSAVTPSTVPYGSPFPAPTTDHNCKHLSEQSSPHGVAPATQIIPSFHCSSLVNLEKHESVATSLDSTQSPTDASTISPTTNSDSGPLPLMAVSTSAPPSGDPLDPQCLDVFPSISSSSFLAPVPSNTLPAQPESSSMSPASRIDQVTPGPVLISSTLATAI